MALVRDAAYADSPAANVNEAEQMDVLTGILDQLRLMNMYLGRIAGEQFTIADIEG